jgi:hypothetical protein
MVQGKNKKKFEKKRQRQKKLTEEMPTLATDDLNGTYEEIEKDESLPAARRRRRKIDRVKGS